MAYAIGEIIYGIDLTDHAFGHDDHAAYRETLQELDEDQRHVKTAYSGNGDAPMWLGVDLGNIDECNAVDGQWLIGVLTVTEEVKATYQTLLEGVMADDELTEEFKQYIKSLTPKSQILWGSS